jgi:hypothetical protein
MATQVQFRRGTSSQNNAFTGAQGELTIDTDVWTLRIHDGSTVGGRQVPTLSATQTFTNKTFSTNCVWSGTAIATTRGGTGANISGVAGAIVYSTGSAMGVSLGGTSGQVLTSGGSSAPTWVNASALSTGTATTATTATNISGGSAGYLMYQSDTNTTGFIAPGLSGYVLRSTGASTAPSWVNSAVTIGSSAVNLGDTVTDFAGVTTFTISGTTDSSSSTTGSFKTAGGAGIAKSLYVGGNIVVTGDLTVNGTTTTVNSTTVDIADLNITVAKGAANSSAANGAGLTVDGASATMTYTHATASWNFNKPLKATNTDYWLLPVGNIAARPGTAVAGMIRYNSEITAFEGYASGAWSSLGGVKSVDGYTYIRAETSAGAGNGDLDFFAENSGGDGSTQVGQWNRTNFKDYTGTLLGSQTTQNLFNTVATTINLGGAATTINIGAGSTGAVTNFAKNVVISGNLTVTGTTTTNSSASLSVSDSAVYLNNGATDNTKDIGLIGTYVATGTKYAGLVKDASDGIWKFFSAPTNAPTAGSVVDFTGATYDAVKMGALTATNGTFSAALTYGGVTLSNAVTGTGNMVLSADPTLTGTLTGSVASFSSTVATGALTVTGNMTATGSVTAYFSDDRLKTRTGNIQNALEKVLSLDGFHYHANETAVALGYDGSKEEVGLSAQQVQAVLPEVVAPAQIDPQYMTLHYERIVPLLVEAIKEQQKQIEELKAKLGN